MAAELHRPEEIAPTLAADAAPAVHEAPDDAALARALPALLDLIAEQVERGLPVNLVAFAVACLGLSEAIAPGWLAAWFGASVVVSLARYAVVLGYRHRRDAVSLPTWDALFGLTLVAASLVWSVGGTLLMPELTPFLRAFLLLFVFMVAAGVAILYSAQRMWAVVGVAGLTSPFVVWLALEPDLHHRIMAGLGVIFVVGSLWGLKVQGNFVLRSFSMAEALAQARDDAERTARTDALTGLPNRRFFEQAASYLFEQSRRDGRPLALAVFDVDHFKSINDEQGHAAGDRALRAVAEALEGAGRQLDVVSRLGGDEFAVLLPGSSAAAATGFVDRVRARLRGDAVGLTCSVGVAERVGEDTVEVVMARADRALYRSKSQGRDRMRVGTARD